MRRKGAPTGGTGAPGWYIDMDGAGPGGMLTAILMLLLMMPGIFILSVG